MNNAVVLGIGSFIGFVAGRLILTKEMKKEIDGSEERIKEANRLFGEAEKMLEKSNNLEKNATRLSDEAEKSIKDAKELQKKTEASITAIENSIRYLTEAGIPVPTKNILETFDELFVE